MWAVDGLLSSLGLRFAIHKMEGLSQMLPEDSSTIVILNLRGSKMEGRKQKERGRMWKVTAEKERKEKKEKGKQDALKYIFNSFFS